MVHLARIGWNGVSIWNPVLVHSDTFPQWVFLAVVNGVSFILVVGHTAVPTRVLLVFCWIISGVTFGYSPHWEWWCLVWEVTNLVLMWHRQISWLGFLCCYELEHSWYLILLSSFLELSQGWWVKMTCYLLMSLGLNTVPWFRGVNPVSRGQL